MLFDQIDFQQQRLFFPGCYNIFKIVDITDTAGGFKIVSADKILPYALLQLFCFSNLNHISVLVFP